ncbi:MAG: nucleoside-diphosphate-sugar epimerase, partial [Myxococcales bacterium]|nr:nucleoside-diphosphate-sugar epimerase [Myxococcales bacterium]
ANLLAGLAATEGAIALNIGAGSTTTVLELAETILATMGSKAKPTFTEARAGDVRYSRADASLARGAINWEATVALDEGLALTRPE